MLSRRTLLPALTAAAAVAALPRAVRAEDFGAFLAGVRAEGRRSGISAVTLDRALAGVQPNQKVLDKIAHPAETTLTWTQYRTLLVTPQRIQDGRAAYRRDARLFGAVQDRFGVGAPVILGIWGLEFELWRQDRRLWGDRIARDPRLGQPPARFLPRRADGGAAHPAGRRHHPRRG